MKKYFALLILIFAVKISSAQSDTSKPIYQRFPGIPPFIITKVPDSIAFDKDDLKKKKATLIMVFSPDCEHCQHATKDLLDHYSLFKNVQIVMASPLEYRFIKPFYENYQIAKYPNITMGRDATYFLGTFFGIHNFPAMFLYDKKGNFKERFDGSVSFEKIATYL